MFVIRLLSRLPLRILYGISDFLFFLSYYVVRYRRKMVWKNLGNAFPQKTPVELRQIEKKFYRNLCDYAVEMLKLLTIRREELARRMVFKNTEVAMKHYNRNQSVLHLTSHQFNWEWLLAAGSFTYPAEMNFVYQPVNNASVNDLTNEVRTRFGAHPIRRDSVAREAVKRRNILHGIAIVADQYPGYGHDKKYTARFLNQETVFFYGTNQLAVLTQYPAVYYKLKKVKRGYYEATVVEIAAPPYAKESDTVIENYVRVVEEVIQEDPAGWLWSHNRWKTRHLKKA